MYLKHCIFFITVIDCQAYRLPTSTSSGNELGTPFLQPSNTLLNGSMTLLPLSKTVLNSTITEENNRAAGASDSTLSYGTSSITSEGVQTLFDVSENTLQNKAPQVASNQTTSTNNVFSDEDKSSACPLISLSSTSGTINERGTISYGFTTNPCMTAQSHRLNRNHLDSIVQMVKESLNKLMYDTKTLLSNIVSIFLT
jgi:hypothetical protein